MIKIRKDTTEYQLNAQKYCIDNKIDVDTTNDQTGWAIWITFPDGTDEVYACFLLEDEMTKQYWNAITYAAGLWWDRQKASTTVKTPPAVPKVPSVPKIPKVPKVPSVPQIPRVPKVPQIPKN
tara:strand:+ start:23986 stop:24354 length:369 start_codon:yes stop_codon:yes gene_type:complete